MFSWGCFLSHFVYPQIRPISTTAAPPGVGLFKNLRNANLKRITSSVDVTLLVTTHSLQGTNQPKVQTQRVKNGCYVYVPIKHLEIIFT